MRKNLKLISLLWLFCWGCHQPQQNKPVQEAEKPTSLTPVVKDAESDEQRTFNWYQEYRYEGKVDGKTMVLYIRYDLAENLWCEYRASYYFLNDRKIHQLLGSAIDRYDSIFRPFTATLQSADTINPIIWLTNDLFYRNDKYYYENYTIYGHLENDTFKGMFKKGKKEIFFRLQKKSLKNKFRLLEHNFKFVKTKDKNFITVSPRVYADGICRVIADFSGFFVDAQKYPEEAATWQQTIAPFFAPDSSYRKFDFDDVPNMAKKYVQRVQKNPNDINDYEINRHIYTLYQEQQTVSFCFFAEHRRDSCNKVAPILDRRIYSFDKSTLQKIRFNDIFIENSEDSIRNLLKRIDKKHAVKNLDEFIVTDRNIQYSYFIYNHILSELNTVVLPLDSIRAYLKPNPYLN